MRVLFLGVHCDDLELGCGATINKHQHDWQINCHIFSHLVPINGQLIDLQSTSEQSLASLGVQQVTHHHYPANHLHLHRQAIWEDLQRISKDYQPDLVVTHAPDEHQDHTTLHLESVRVFNGSVITYKPTMRYTTPIEWQWCEVVTAGHTEAKQRALSFYSAWQNKLYFNPSNIEAQLRVCGLTCGHEYAEGYEVVRLIR